MPPALPVTALAGAAGKEPSAAGPVKSFGTHAVDNDDDYYYEDGVSPFVNPVNSTFLNCFCLESKCLILFHRGRR